MKAIIVAAVLALAGLAWAQPKVELKPGEKAVVKVEKTQKARVLPVVAVKPAAKVAPAASQPASQPAAALPKPAPVDPAVKQPQTPAEAVAATRDVVGGLRAHRWWGAAAGGIFLVLFLLGCVGMWRRIGTFWAWVAVGVLSLAAGVFAAFDKTGFNWNTFYGYLSAGPTVAWLRDFFRVVMEKFKEWRESKKPSAPAEVKPG